MAGEVKGVSGAGQSASSQPVKKEGLLKTVSKCIGKVMGEALKKLFTPVTTTNPSTFPSGPTPWVDPKVRPPGDYPDCVIKPNGQIYWK